MSNVSATSSNSAAEWLEKTENCTTCFYCLYNYPSYYYDYLLNKNEDFKNLLNSKDYASITLESFKQKSFNRSTKQSKKATKEVEEDTEKATARDNAIAFYETLLGKEETFEQLTANQREQVLAAVKEKLAQRRSGKYSTSSTSPFLFFVQEQNKAGHSKWYDYIMSADKKYLIGDSFIN